MSFFQNSSAGIVCSPTPRFPHQETYGGNLAELMAQPNWYSDPNSETRLGSGPCQVGSVQVLRPPHFWSAQPSLAELSFRERELRGALGGPYQSQANWCVANDQCCGNKTWGANAKAMCTTGCCGVGKLGQ